MMSNTDAICKRCGSGYWLPVCDAVEDTGYCTDACHIAELEAALAHERNKCTMTKVCHWSEDEDNNWFGSCGIGWCFSDRPASPSDHRMRFCPQCGGEIIQHDYDEKESE